MNIFIKLLIGSILFVAQLQAGMFTQTIKNVAKDKAKNKIVDVGKSVYTQRKDIRRTNEAKLGTKSKLSKIEDNIEYKKQVTTAKTKEFIGNENIQNYNKTKNSINDFLIGK